MHQCPDQLVSCYYVTRYYSKCCKSRKIFEANKDCARKFKVKRDKSHVKLKERIRLCSALICVLQAKPPLLKAHGARTTTTKEQQSQTAMLNSPNSSLERCSTTSASPSPCRCRTRAGRLSGGSWPHGTEPSWYGACHTDNSNDNDNNNLVNFSKTEQFRNRFIVFFYKKVSNRACPTSWWVVAAWAPSPGRWMTSGPATRRGREADRAASGSCTQTHT